MTGRDVTTRAGEPVTRRPHKPETRRSIRRPATTSPLTVTITNPDRLAAAHASLHRGLGCICAGDLSKHVGGEA